MKKTKLKPGWTMVNFGDVVRQVKDKVDPETSGLERYVAGEHMNTDDLRIKRWGKIGDGYLGPAFHMRFKRGQVLYGSRRTYLRKVARADFDGICANTTYILEPKQDNRLLPELLPFIMQTPEFNAHSVQQSRGSVNPYVNFSDLEWFEFPLPPLDEQRRIAEVLWAAEELAKKIEHLENRTNRLEQSLKNELFCKKHSSTVSVGNVGNWISGGTPSRKNTEYWSGSIPWISPKDMKVSILEDSLEHISDIAVEKGAKIIPRDSILIVIRGMILAHTFPVARTALPASFNQDMKALLADERFKPEYLQSWFEWAAPRYLQLVSESSHGTKRLESEQLFSLRVPFLPNDKQHEFIVQLRCAKENRNRINVRQQYTIKLKKQLLRDCFGGGIQ